jgi:hypothetical protein
MQLLDLFPAAAAVSLLSVKWETATYLPALDAFDRNEHCAQVAVSSLLAVFHLILSSAQSPAAAVGSKKVRLILIAIYIHNLHTYKYIITHIQVFKSIPLIIITSICTMTQSSAGSKKGKAGISSKKEKRRSANTDHTGIGMDSEETKGDADHK